MANVNTAISLTDNFTPQLRNIANAISTISSNLNDLEFNKTFDPSKVKAMNEAAKTLDRSVSDLEKEMGSAAQAVDTIGNESVSTSNEVDGLADALDSINGKLDFSNALQGFQAAQSIVGGVVGAVQAVSSTALEAAETVSDSTNKIRMGLGATAQEAQAFENIAQNVFRDNFGESLDEVTDRLVYVQQVMGDTVNQADLEPLIEQFITLDDNGMDFNETVRGANNLMTYFGVSAQEATDLLATGMQRGLNFTDELGDNLAEYSGRWAEAGVSASSYFSLLEAGTKSGAYNLDKVGDFLNEFLTSLSDGRLAENLGAFSTGTQEVFAAFQSGGANAQDVLNAVLGDMQNMTSATDKAALASTLWSALGEDNALGMIESLSGVTDSYTDIAGAAQEMADNNSNSVSQMYRSWDAFKLSLAPVGESLASMANTALEYLTPFVDYLTENGETVVTILSAIGGGLAAFATYSFVSGIMDSIKAATEGMTLAQAAYNMVMNANPIMLVVTALGALAAAVVYLWNTNEGFRNAVIEIWNGIVATFQQAWTNIQGVFASLAAGWDEAIVTVQNFWFNLTNTVSGWWTSAQEWGSNLIQGFIDGLTNAWNNVTGWVTEKFNWIVTTVKSVFGIASPSTVFNEIGSNLLQGFWDGLTAMWDSIAQWATDSWNWLTNLFSGGSQEDNTQIVDYSAQIEATRTQLADLQAEVQAGYDNILITVNSSIARIVAQGSTMFFNLTQSIIADSSNMVVGVNANIAQIPGIIATSLAGVIPIAQSYFIGLQGLFTAQINNLVALSNNALTALLPVFQAVLDNLRGQSVNLLIELQNAAVNVVTNMSNLIVSGIELMSQNIIGLLAILTDNYLTAWNNLAQSTVEILNRLATNVVRITQNMVKAVTTEINRLPGVFRNSADNAMNSFIEGISSAIPGAVGVTNTLVSAVKQAFITGLGINSPSKETYWYGQMTGLGFIKGLSDSQLVQFAKSILTEIIDAFAEGRFKPEELVAYLGDDTLKVISEIESDPELMEKAGQTMSAEEIAYPLIGTLGTQTSWFGPRKSPGGIGSTNHGGVDLAAPTGTPIAAALGGSVTRAGWYDGYGNAVVINSGNGVDITYGHMSRVLAQVGQTVAKGAQIGLVGSTGNSTGPHLHFEMHQNGAKIDPQPYIEGASITAGNTVVAAIQNAYNSIRGLSPLAMTMGQNPFNQEGLDELLKRLSSSKGYATGTPSATAGLHWVGENGPELVTFNGGERVFTNSESRALINNSSRSRTNNPGTGVINNTPVEVKVEIGTINNNEDLNFTIDKFKNMLGETIDDILYNDPKGMAVG